MNLFYLSNYYKNYFSTFMVAGLLLGYSEQLCSNKFDPTNNQLGALGIVATVAVAKIISDYNADYDAKQKEHELELQKGRITLQEFETQKQKNLSKEREKERLKREQELKEKISLLKETDRYGNLLSDDHAKALCNSKIPFELLVSALQNNTLEKIIAQWHQLETLSKINQEAIINSKKLESLNSETNTTIQRAFDSQKFAQDAATKANYAGIFANNAAHTANVNAQTILNALAEIERTRRAATEELRQNAQSANNQIQHKTEEAKRAALQAQASADKSKQNAQSARNSNLQAEAAVAVLMPQPSAPPAYLEPSAPPAYPGK